MKFNAKSAGVTSMMLIMAFIGTLTPTLFYQTYGSVRTLSSFRYLNSLEVLSVPVDLRWLSFRFRRQGCPLGLPTLLLRASRSNGRPILSVHGKNSDVFLRSGPNFRKYYNYNGQKFIRQLTGIRSRTCSAFGFRSELTPVKFGRTLNNSYRLLMSQLVPTELPYTTESLLESTTGLFPF